MKRPAFLISPILVVVLFFHTYLPYREATRFNAAVLSANVSGINTLLSNDASFGNDSSIPIWYSFHSREKLVVGPFPLAEFKKKDALNLRIESPSGLDWILGRRPIRVFGPGSFRWFVASYSKVSYRQAQEPDSLP